MLISCMVTMQLICTFVFTCAKSRFSHDAGHIYILLKHFRYTVSGGFKQMYKLRRPVTHSKCKIEDAMIYKGFTVSCNTTK